MSVKREGVTEAGKLVLDPRRTAIVPMDFQNDIVKNVTEPIEVVKNATSVLKGARKAGIRIFHIQHRGGPYASEWPGADIVDPMKPEAGETLFVKTKAGPFSTTGLDVTLRENGIDTVVLMGVITSGCVLSAARWAADINYKFVVVSDACADRDAEVHRVLTEKVYPYRGTVVTSKEFVSAVCAS